MGGAVTSVLEALDERLARMTLVEGSIPIYEIALRDAAGGGRETWTWDVTSGMRRDTGIAPTCRIETDVEALDDLLAGRCPITELYRTQRLVLGGLFWDYIALESLFRESTQAFWHDIRLAQPSTRAKARLVEQAKRALQDVTRDESETARIRGMLDRWRDRRLDVLRPGQCSFIDFEDMHLPPNLGDRLELTSLLAEHHEGLRAEAEQFLRGEVKTTRYGEGELVAAGSDTLQAMNFVGDFRWRSPEVLAPFPTAARLLAEVSKRWLVCAAGYLVMAPGKAIETHNDGDSWIAATLYGLIVPEQCDLTIGANCYEHREGQLISFNDAFMHSAGNKSSSTRILFGMLLAGTGMTEVELGAMRKIVTMFPRGSICQLG